MKNSIAIMFIKGLSLTLIISVIFCSCSKEGNNNPSPSQSPPSASFTATVDGKPFTATSIVATVSGLTAKDSLSNFGEISFYFAGNYWPGPGTFYELGLIEACTVSYGGNIAYGDCGYGNIYITENTLIKGSGVGGPNTFTVAGTFDFTIGGTGCPTNPTIHTIKNGSFSNVVVPY